MLYKESSIKAQVTESVKMYKGDEIKKNGFRLTFNCISVLIFVKKEKV